MRLIIETEDRELINDLLHIVSSHLVENAKDKEWKVGRDPR